MHHYREKVNKRFSFWKLLSDVRIKYITEETELLDFHSKEIKTKVLSRNRN